jgi:hypothetical protein
MIFSTHVGFPGRGIEDYFETYKQMCENGEVVVANGAKYLTWAPGEGVEVWTRIEEGGPDANFHSYFAGGARMKVALLEKTARASRVFSEGAFFCRGGAFEGEGWIAGCLPFVFDAPFFHLYDGLSLPRLCAVQLTGFASIMKGFEYEEEFDEEFPADDEGYCWDYKHFIPESFLKPRGEGGELQPSRAAVSGYVADTGIITNPVTGLDFCWARVETIGGEVDIVCSPDNLHGYLVKGGLAVANCYLCGRLVDE